MNLKELGEKISRQTKKSKKILGHRPLAASSISASQKNFEDQTVDQFPAILIHHRKKNHQLLIFLIIAFLIIIGTAGFFIIQYFNAPNVQISLSGPSDVFIGVPFKINFNVSNPSNSLIRQLELNINLPTGLVYLDVQENKETITDNLGDVQIGGSIQKSYTLLATSDSVGTKNLTAILSYQAGLGTSFEQRESKDIEIKKPALVLAMKMPNQVVAGSEFGVEINYQNISNYNFANVNLEVTYPASFQFNSASVPPTSFNNFWNLTEIKAGQTGLIKIWGSLGETVDKNFDFQAVLKTNFGNQSYILAQETANGQLAPAPINLSLSLNESENYVARLGELLTYNLHYENNSGIPLADNVIKVKLLGELFDFQTLKSNASFDSSANTLIWNAANLPELRLLNPAASGDLNFSLKLKDKFPIRRLNDKNFHLKVQAQMESPTVPYYLSTTKTSAVALLDTKVRGLTTIAAEAYFRDAAAGIWNSGPFPPKVNQPTEYAIHWIIRNYSTDIHHIKVSASLEPGVSFTNVVKSNINSLPFYNNSTQEVVWNIDKIQATKGILSEPVEAIFQIRAVPNDTQVGNFQPLLTQTKIQAEDDYTGLILENSAAAVNTQLPNDPTVKTNEGKVQL